MDSVPTYWVIGMILSIIMNIVLLILHFSELVHTIRSFPKRSYKWLKRRPRVCKERRWWKNLCPSWEIDNVGKLEITEIRGEYHSRYHMELKIDVRYKSGDSRYSTWIDCTRNQLDVLNLGTGRERKPYRLRIAPPSYRIEPPSDDGMLLNISLNWELPRNEEWVIRFTFRGDEMAEPRLGKSTDCKIVTIGIPRIERLPLDRELRGVGRKFPVEVNKQYER